MKIIIELGLYIGFASSDDEIAIVESSENHGNKQKSPVGMLLKRFAGVIKSGAKVATGVEFNVDGGTQIPDAYLLLRRYQEQEKRKIWLLVDDIDAKFNGTLQEQSLIGAFFSVSRELTATQNKKVADFNIRATVRADVARTLSELEDEDKYRDYRTVISWSDKELQVFLGNRVATYFKKQGGLTDAQRKKKDTEGLLQEIFDPKGFSWAKQKISVSLALIQLGGRRPRWISELCKKSGDIAKRNKRDRVWFDDILEAMADFGRDRVADINKEHKHQFSDVQKLISAFRSGPPKYTRHALLNRIEKNYEVLLGAANVPKVLGAEYRVDNRHLLGQFLYISEFIQAEVGTGKFGEWLFYHSDPDAFDSPESRSNNIKWTINPVFRQHLQIKKELDG